MVPRNAIRFAVMAALALAGSGAAAAPWRVAAGPERVPLEQRSAYERYVTIEDLLDVAPDSARVLAARWRRERPGDIVAAYAHVWTTLRRDSAAGDAVLARAAADSADLDAAALAAMLHLSRRRTESARHALDRLARAHAARGDAIAGAWALVMRQLRDASAPGAAEDAQQALALAARSADTRERAEIELLLADRGGPRTHARNAEALGAALDRSRAASMAARGEAMRRLANALRADGRHDEAEAANRAAAALADSCGWTRLSLRAARGIASVARALGRVAESAERTRAFADSSRALGFDEQYAEALQDLGNLHLMTGRLPEARAALEERLALIEARRWHSDQRMMTLDQLGGVAATEGRLDEARVRFEEALELSRRRRDHPYAPSVLLHLANLERDMGDDTRALATLEQGFAAARAVGSRRTESMMFALKADILADAGRLEEAASLAAEAARHARAHEPRNLPMALRTQSHALIVLGRAREAQAPLDSLRAFLGGAPDSLQLSRLGRAEAEVALALGDTARALALTAHAVELARAIGSPDETASAELAHGLALQGAGRVAESAAALEAGLAFFERMVAATAARDERSRTQRRFQWYYGDLARAHHAAGRTAETFALLEGSRARELRAQFGDASAIAAPHVPAPLAAELRECEQALATMQQALLEQWALPLRQRDPALPRLEARSDSLKRVWGDLQLRVQREAPRFARAAGWASPMTLAEVQARLRPGETLVAFMMGWQRLLRFDVTAEGCVVHELPWDDRQLTARVSRWVAACRDGGSDAWRPGAAALADTLLAGLELPRGAGATLLIVPDGALHTMPFEALLVRDGARRVPLLERAVVVLAEAPGLFFMPEPEAGRRAAGGIVAFGDPALTRGGEAARDRALSLAPLPHARREVERLREAFPEARLHIGAEATEPRLHAALDEARIVHVAAHGFYDDRHPRFSALALARGEQPGEAGSDGMLQAWEVLAHRGSLDLVTLSACETGRGRLLGGEGLDGLARAFRVAGARQLIVSLWRVDDAATATLMGDFYRRLARGEPVAAAFREARLALARGGDAEPGAARGVGRTRERTIAAHPRVWAAFVLRGAR